MLWVATVTKVITTARKETSMSDTPAEMTLTDALDAAGEFVYLCTPDGALLDWNAELPAVTGLDDETLSAEGLNALGPAGEELQTAIEQARTGGATARTVVAIDTASDGPVTYEWSFTPTEAGPLVGTARTLATPDQADAELSTSMPVVEIWDGIVLSPIVGKLSANQAERFTETLLQEIVEYEATIALIDITGVQSVDTQTAQHLIDTIRAVDLLGANVIITGIGPDLSQTLVKLGIGFEAKTRASLIDGFKTALEMRGVSV